MKTLLTCLISLASLAHADPALTIYNGGFAIVRDELSLSLNKGENTVTYANATANLEPQSVVLRDPQGKADFSILEQTYRADPISQGLLLSLFEGKTIEFETVIDDKPVTVSGKVLRSGYEPQSASSNRFGNQYRSYPTQDSGQPIIEVDGKLRFGLPGIPIFPSLGDDTILKPTLEWTIDAPRKTSVDAELSYLTSGMSWLADYNIVAPENSDTVDFVGWITMDNQTGRSFENAHIKLLAGDVNKVDPNRNQDAIYEMEVMAMRAKAAPEPNVSEKSFDDFHLYTIARPTTLRDRETKQVEFVHASGVKAKRVYLYDGAFLPYNNYRGWNREAIRQDESFGTQSNPKVWIYQEIENTEENGLGIPLPKGKVRFYREDSDDQQLEFTGENLIDHTPKKELIRIQTGNAFDIVGERNRDRYNVDHRAHWIKEAFTITLTNRKDTPVTVRAVEHLYRWDNWKITSSSLPYQQVDSDTLHFEVEIPADSKTTLSYEVEYTW